MAKAGKGADLENVVVIEPVQTGAVTVPVVGMTPLILNRMSQKAQRELLLPRGRKTSAQRQAELKHDPLEEYRAAPYVLPDGAPTLLAVMASAFKGAMLTAALDQPNARKAQIGRLVYVAGDFVPIYGVPKLHMSIVRSADINRTPDVRTRMIVPRWAALVDVRFVVPFITQQSVVNLLTTGGVTAGIGDWRPEKGKGSYGQFRVATSDDPEFLGIVTTGGRDAQLAATEDPEPYDRETAELLAWFESEILRRGRPAQVKEAM